MGDREMKWKMYNPLTHKQRYREKSEKRMGDREMQRTHKQRYEREE